MKSLKPSLTAIMASIGLMACATTDYGTRQVGEAPADNTTTEAGLWMQMTEVEKGIKISGARNTDKDLNAYINALACDVTGDYCSDLRVYIVEAPLFNASMSPNGMMLVNTGLLLRAESEAELAFVLAHEFGHYVENHTMERIGSAKNSMAWGSVLDVATGIATGVPLGTLMAASSIMSFSREKEREADIVGLKTLGDAGYDTSASVSIWENLSREIEASGNKRKRKSLKSQSIFNSHPPTAERIAYLNNQSAAYMGNKNDIEGLQSIKRPFLSKWLAADISNRDYGSSLHLIKRLQGTHTRDLGKLKYAEGEVYRLRGQVGDKALALETYTEATTHEDCPTEAWRQIGDLQKRAGQDVDAIAALSTYLSRNPEARDRALIENMIQKMESEST